PRRLEVDEVRNRRQDHRHLEPLVDARVELDVHRPGVLDVERVAERSADEQPAARDREDQVRLVTVCGDPCRQLPRRQAELRPAEPLALAGHAGASAAVRACRITSSRICSRLRCGCQPIAPLILSIDGSRWSTSSMPRPYTSSCGTNLISELDSVSSSTRRARSMMRTRSGEPTLKISPESERVSIRSRTARIVSCTWQNERVWVPSPCTSSGSPASAWPTKRGITMPY